MGNSLQLLKILGFMIVLGIWGSPANSFIVGHQQTDLSAIPDERIEAAKSDLHIAYNHTSHGSQIITGMYAAEDFPSFGTKYSWTDTTQGDSNSLSLDDSGIPGRPDLSQGDVDSDGDGINDWAEDTYAYLNQEWVAHQNSSDHDFVNVVMWSWCNIAGHNIPRYIRSMEWLIAQFSDGGSSYTDSVMTVPATLHDRAASHPVKFVFMTGHANNEGEGDSSDSRNVVIRAHCHPNNWDRILFDFSDIENYDPDGNYYLDKRVTDALYYDKNGSHDANWADEYLTLHDGEELYKQVKGDGSYSGCSSCSHSEGPDEDARLNCVLKGRAAWHLFARLAGWNGGESLKGDMDGSGELTAADAIVGLKVLAGFDSTVAPEGDADGDGVVGMSDILYLLVELAKP